MPVSRPPPVAEAETSPQDEPSLLNDDDVSLLARLNASDWDQLDDTALEALAERLAMEEMGLPIEENKNKARDDADAIQSEGRVSFKIGVSDPDNAPIPPLEKLDTSMRAAAISFRGLHSTPEELATPEELEKTKTDAGTGAQPVEEITTPASDATISASSSPATLVEDKTTEPHDARMSRPLDQEEAAVLAKRSQSKQGTSQRAPSIKSEQENRTANITWTVRKTDGGSVKVEQQPATNHNSPSYGSATEDDWLKALEKLTGEYDPNGTTLENFSPPRNTGHMVEAAETTDASKENESTQPDLPVMVGDTSTGQSLDTVSSASSFAIEGIPLAIELAEEVAAEYVASEEPSLTQETSELQGPLIHEHAPLGFMPDMVSFANLDLIEAEPDLPSATELLLAKTPTLCSACRAG